MSGLFAWIAAVAVSAPLDVRYPAAIEVYRCDFEESSDDDFDGWPQGWTRHSGPGYPHYLEMHLSREPAPQGSQCWRFDLNGGAASTMSPLQPFDAGSEYLVEAYLKTEKLRHDDAFVVLHFLDERRRPVQSEFGPRMTGAVEWTKIRIGPVLCENPQARYVAVELHLKPTDEADLFGAACFDDVWLARLPRKNVRGSRPYNVFHHGEPIELSLTLTGLVAAPDRAKLELFDRAGRLVASEVRPATPLETRPGAKPRARLGPGARPEVPPQKFTWTPTLTELGYFRGRVIVYDADGREVHEDATALVVVRPVEQLRDAGSSVEDQFGWSFLRTEDVPLPDQLHVLLHESGVRRIKYPVWYDAQDKASGQKIRTFVERMNVQGVGVVGTLTPAVSASAARYLPSEYAAVQTFRKSRDEWFPAVEPVLLDLAFKLRGWQLGDDRDLGFLNLPGAVERIEAVKREFDRIEQDSAIGTTWSWLREPPPGERPTWRFLAMTAAPELTADEMIEQLRIPAPAGTSRWLTVSALPADEYSIEQRARDLVARLVAAKSAGADALYFLSPFSSETGLMEPSGAPGELYLPWRTVALLLDGAKPVGSLRLPEGSENRLFLRGKDAALLLSRAAPGIETAELPGDVRFFDLWGGPIEPRLVDGRRVVDVGVVPIVAVGLHRETVRWSEACRLEKTELRELFGAPQPATLEVKNTFGRPIRGRLTIGAPDGWMIQPRTFDVSVAEGESLRLPFQVTLPTNGETGPQMLRIEHDLMVDEQRTFTLYRDVQVGGSEILMEVETRLVGDELEVEQRLINNSRQAASFRCELFAPNQRRVRTQAIEVHPGIDIRRYRLPDGRSMNGRTLWIKAEEVGGTRIISKRFTVGDDA